MTNPTSFMNDLTEFARKRSDAVHSPVLSSRKEFGMPDFTVKVTVGHDDHSIDVFFCYRDVGSDDLTFDVNIETSSNDWAHPREQHRAIGLALDWWEAQGLDSSFKALGTVLPFGIVGIAL